MKSILGKFFNAKPEDPKTMPQINMSPLRDLSEQPQPQMQNQPLPQAQAKTQNTEAQQQPITEPQYLRKETLGVSTGEIVIVNKEPVITKKEGFYYNKYKERIMKLNISPNLGIERENMRVNFDKDIFDYLISDLQLIFDQTSNSIERNQKTLLEEIDKSKELISAYALLRRNTSASFEEYQKDIAMIDEVDQLEALINSINEEADSLLKEVNALENKLFNSKKQS